MTTVIRVDPDDELPILLERLPAGAPCVVVLPPHARALNSLVGAKLLSRRADALGSRVAVVTDEYTVMAHAAAAGLPAAATIDEAQRMLGNGATDTGDEEEPDLLPEDDDGVEDGAADDATRPATAVFTAGALRARPSSEPQERAGAAADAADQEDVTPGGDGPATFVRGHSGGHKAAQAGSARRATSAPHQKGTPGAPPPAPPGSRPRASLLRSGRGLGGLLLPVMMLMVPLALLLWLASYVLTGLLNPSASLTVHPRAGAVIGNAQVLAVLNLPPAKHSATRIAMALADQREEHTVSLPVRGIKLLPGHVATGRLLLGNLTTRPLLVPAGTTFTTVHNAVGFVSTKAISLPAAVETFSSVTYGTGAVPVRAAAGGKAGNVPARAIVNVPASFTGALKVENPVPTTGGTDIPERVVAPRDLTVAAASLFGILEQEARHDIARLHNWDIEQHTLYVARSPVAPRLAPDRRSATLTLSVVLHAAYVHRSDLQPASRAALQPALNLLPHTTLIDRSVTWTTNWQPAGPTRQIINLSVNGHTTAPLNVADLLRGISGRSKAAAQAYLAARSDVASARLDLSPPWADHLPGDVTRIHVTVGEAE